ncbi:MAG: hypothetical protein R3Y53_10385 [Bacillota bacterium]
MRVNKVQESTPRTQTQNNASPPSTTFGELMQERLQQTTRADKSTQITKTEQLEVSELISYIEESNTKIRDSFLLPPTAPVQMLRSLTTEEIIDFNSCYDLDSMEKDSFAYNQLLIELNELGVLSGIPSKLPLHVTNIFTNDDGEITRYVTDPDVIPKIATSAFSTALQTSAERLHTTLTGDESKDEHLAQGVFEIQYATYQTMQNIFAELNSL